MAALLRVGGGREDRFGLGFWEGSCMFRAFRAVGDATWAFVGKTLASAFSNLVILKDWALP